MRDNSILTKTHITDHDCHLYPRLPFESIRKYLHILHSSSLLDRDILLILYSLTSTIVANSPYFACSNSRFSSKSTYRRSPNTYKTASQLSMHLDGYVDNAFPWLGNYPSSSSPQDRDGAHPTPGTPATPGWILPTPGNTPTPGMPPTPRTLVDPPRPPREGYEWVWFPDGFWAEREIAAESPWKGIGLDSKLRRWKGKSSKSQGSVDLDQSLAPRGSVSRRGSGSSSAGPFSPQSHTPFRTERELVQALQGSSDSSEPFWGYPFGVVTLSTEKKEGSSSSPNSTVKGFRRGSWPGTQTILEEADEDETGLQASTSPLARLKALGRRKEVSQPSRLRRSSIRLVIKFKNTQKRKTRSSDKGPLDESVSETSDSYAPAHHSNARKLLSKLSWRKRETPEESGFLSLIEEETCRRTVAGRRDLETDFEARSGPVKPRILGFGVSRRG